MLERLSDPAAGLVGAAAPPLPIIEEPSHGGTDATDRKIVFTYWLGHGLESAGGESVLFASNSRAEGREIPEDIISTKDFAAHFKDQVQRPGILPVFLLDACGGHQFIIAAKGDLERKLNHDADALKPPAGRDYILIAARSSQGVTFPGRTAENLLRLLDSESDQTEKSAGDTVSQLTDMADFPFRSNIKIEIDSLARTAEKMKPPLVVEYNNHQLVLTRTRPMPPGMTVAEQEDYRIAIERAGTDVTQFFLPKGGWDERAGELTWDFAGREAERGRIARWLETKRGLLVVTGEPGAGKSALLGDVIMRSDPAILRAVVRRGLAKESEHDETLAQNAPSATLNLIGRTAKDAAEQLGIQAFQERWTQDSDPSPTTDASGRPTGSRDRPTKWERHAAQGQHAVGHDSTAGGKDLNDPVKRLLALAEKHSSPLSFVVDGLDESAEP
jgi:hypothetical protein